jgi:hypothetical protein
MGIGGGMGILGLLKSPVPNQGATDKLPPRRVRLLGESACPCLLLMIQRKTRTRETEQKSRSVSLVRGTRAIRPSS